MTESRIAGAAALVGLAVAVMAGCMRERTSPAVARSAGQPAVRAEAAAEAPDTCVGPYAAYWNDPTNQPPPGAGHVFRLSQAYPRTLPDIDAAPWNAFDPFSATTLEAREQASRGYLMALLEYVLEGNIGASPAETDFDLCRNPIRAWFHVPWMDANPGKGREYVHGLTRELSPSAQKLGRAQRCDEVAWAVGFYNARGAYTIGQLFPGRAPDDVVVPSTAVSFPTGTVVGKALFTSATVEQVDHLAGAPTWTANVLPPACGGRTSGTAHDACRNTTVACRRAPTSLRLAQFDVAVVDERAPLRWVFGTFAYDGLADPSRGWRGLVPVGLMWGNDPGLAPKDTDPNAQDPTRRGLTPPERVTASYMFTAELPPWFRKDLGCAGRLDGPIDNPRSSCMSCHASASVPLVVTAGQKNPCTQATVQRATIVKAPILGDGQCGDPAVDAVWFRDIPASQPIDHASICGDTRWVSLDYSLQLGEALANYRAVDALGASPAAPAAAARGRPFPKTLLDTDR